MLDNKKKFTKEQSEALFLEMNPGYFERDYVRAVPEDAPASEMLLFLRDFDENAYIKTFDGEVHFGYYDGDMDMLRERLRRLYRTGHSFSEKNPEYTAGISAGTWHHSVRSRITANIR